MQPLEIFSVIDECEHGKRKANNASVDEIGSYKFTKDCLAQISVYKNCLHVGIGLYPRLSLRRFFTLGSDRMLPLIVNYQQSILGDFRGLLLELFVYNLLTKTGLMGRTKNLDTGKYSTLSSWKTKKYFQNPSQLNGL